MVCSIRIYVTLYVLTLVKNFKKLCGNVKLFKLFIHERSNSTSMYFIFTKYSKYIKTVFNYNVTNHLMLLFFSIFCPLCILAIFFQRQKVNLKTLETFKKLSLEHLVDRVRIEKH